MGVIRIWSVLVHVASHRHTCIYMYFECARVHTSLLGMHAQPHHQLVLGIWSCSSLPSVGLLGMTSPNRWALLCQKLSNPFPKQPRNDGTREYEICFQDMRNYGLTVTDPFASLPLNLALWYPHLLYNHISLGNSRQHLAALFQ